MAGTTFRDPSDLQTLDAFLSEEGLSEAADVRVTPSDLAAAALERRPIQDATRPTATGQAIFHGRMQSPPAHMFRGTMQ